MPSLLPTLRATVGVAFVLMAMSAAAQDLAVVGARVFPTPEAVPIEDGTVLIRDGRIAAVGSRDSIAVPSGVRVIDGRGASVTAGFWNSHIHLIKQVSVTERTREIGVRMATGARASNILLQFNTEALVVCGIGGLIGVALGFTAGFIAKALGTNVAFTPAPALLALGSALLTGVLFGYLPARKAAYMDPVVALASE